MNTNTQVVYPNRTLISCDHIASYMYETAEDRHFDAHFDHSVARSRESLL